MSHLIWYSKKMQSELKFYTVSEVCDILKMSKSSVYRLIDQKKIHSCIFMNSIRVEKTDLEYFIAESKKVDAN